MMKKQKVDDRKINMKWENRYTIRKKSSYVLHPHRHAM